MAALDRAFAHIHAALTSINATLERFYLHMEGTFDQIVQNHWHDIALIMQATVITDPIMRNYIYKKLLLIKGTILTKFQQLGFDEPQLIANQFIAKCLLNYYAAWFKTLNSFDPLPD